MDLYFSSSLDSSFWASKDASHIPVPCKGIGTPALLLPGPRVYIVRDVFPSAHRPSLHHKAITSGSNVFALLLASVLSSVLASVSLCKRIDY